MQPESGKHVLVLGGSFTGRTLAQLVRAARSEDRSPLPGRFDSLYSTLPAGAESLKAVGRVSFLSRRPDELVAQGYDLFPGPDTPVDLVLDTVPSLEAGQHPFRQAVETLNARQGPVPFVHISSTSVYADCPGSAGSPWPEVNELSPENPSTPSGQKRLELERTLRTWLGPVQVVRSAGLYGRGRALPLHFRAGEFGRLTSGNRIVSRIHVVDLLRLALALAARKELAVVNGVDAEASANRDTFLFLEKELGLTLPGDWRSEPLRGRAVRSLHALALIGHYVFPTFREGFRDALREP